MGATCIASSGYCAFSGSGVSITTYPIVPDYKKYPNSHGRKLGKTFGAMGLACPIGRISPIDFIENTETQTI